MAGTIGTGRRHYSSLILLPLSFKTQQVSRLESPGYEGHSLSMLRRVAEVLHAKMRLAFEPAETKKSMRVAERPARYGIKRLAKRRESGRKRS